MQEGGMVMACAECGKNFVPQKRDDRICPDCLVKFQKRDAFRKLMFELKKISELPRDEADYMTGFSWAEQENFVLIFMALQKRFHFPTKLDDFVNERSKKRAEELVAYF